MTFYAVHRTEASDSPVNETVCKTVYKPPALRSLIEILQADMAKENIRVSEMFVSIRERPLVYFGKIDPHSAMCFIHGFYTGYGITSAANPNLTEARNKILALRGWQSPPVRPEKEMERKGMSAGQINNELLDIEIEAWRLIESAES